MITTIDRVQAQAAELQPIRILLSVLAAPFWVLGVVVGVTLLAVRWMIAAVLVGMTDARAFVGKQQSHGSG